MFDLKVSLFVGGVQKSGTRSLCDYFRKHPEVGVQLKKEAHFFDRPRHFDYAGRPFSAALKRYHLGFQRKNCPKIYCDVTPDYIFRPGAIERVFCYNPEAKWIILLRNPIDRAFSAWNMEVRRGAEKLSFADAISWEMLGRVDVDRAHDRFFYLGRSLYYKQLKNLWRYFPREQCVVVAAESLWRHPEKFLCEITERVGVSFFSAKNYSHQHKGEYSKEMDPRIKERLAEYFRFELDALPDILGWQVNPWVV